MDAAILNSCHIEVSTGMTCCHTIDEFVSLKAWPDSTDFILAALSVRKTAMNLQKSKVFEIRQASFDVTIGC